MSAMSDLMTSIQEEVEKGELSFFEIAELFEVPLEWVLEAVNQMNEEL